MAESVTETNSLVEFVTAQYDILKSKLNSETDSTEAVNAVILLIDTLFQTFKNPDSKHDTIVDQLKALQTAYTELSLDPTDYPHNKNALAGLNAIVDELKDEKGQEEGEE